jgi:hypothetical protein
MTSNLLSSIPTEELRRKGLKFEGPFLSYESKGNKMNGRPFYAENRVTSLNEKRLRLFSRERLWETPFNPVEDEINIHSQERIDDAVNAFKRIGFTKINKLTPLDAVLSAFNYFKKKISADTKLSYSQKTEQISHLQENLDIMISSHPNVDYENPNVENRNNYWRQTLQQLDIINRYLLSKPLEKPRILIALPSKENVRYKTLYSVTDIVVNYSNYGETRLHVWDGYNFKYCKIKDIEREASSMANPERFMDYWAIELPDQKKSAKLSCYNLPNNWHHLRHLFQSLIKNYSQERTPVKNQNSINFA